MLSVSLLGDFCLRYNDHLITDIDTPRLQSLLAYLLLHQDTPQSRAHLAYLFWPDTTEAQARTNLRNLLHHLRHHLPGEDEYLVADAKTICWMADSQLKLDVFELQAALAEASQVHNSCDSDTVRQVFERAASLYQGDLLPGCYDDWIIPIRETLRLAYLNALEHLVQVLEDQRDYTTAIRAAQRLLQLDPLHEVTYRRLIRLHALQGDRASGLRIYHTCTTILRRELDVEPSTATREAYELLLGDETRALPNLTATKAFSPLVGREGEWSHMVQSWRSVAGGGKPHMVMLGGEAGIGKTRLVEDLLQWASRQGIACASGRCYAAEGALAYAPVVTWLRAHPIAPLAEVWLSEVGRILPEIFNQRPDLPKPGAMTEAWQRQRLFEGLSRAILGIHQPLLLTIDDLQWCDRDTLEWLHFLLRFDPEARMLVIGAYRPEEILGDHPLLPFLQALRLDNQVTELDLRPLDEAATRTLARMVQGEELSQETARRLYQETEGNPLFVVETVRAGLPLHGQQSILAASSGSAVSGMGLPPKVFSVIEARLAQLSPPSRNLAGLAATIGREFSFKLLMKASARDEADLVHELDELWNRRIVREHGADSNDFTHDKLREVAYKRMSAGRRRLLHRQVAQALESLHPKDLDPISHQLAVHYEQAGLFDQAVPYYLRAAGVAHQVYANEEAIDLLQHGLALVDEAYTQDPSHPLYAINLQIWEELGDVLEQKAQHEAALQSYRKAQSPLPGSDKIRLARLHRKIGIVLREQRQYAEALAASRQAESALGAQPDETDREWWTEWLEVQVDQVWVQYWLAQWTEIDELVNKIRPYALASGSTASRQRINWALCLMNLRRERYVVSEEMLAEAHEGLAASLELGNLRTRIEWQFETGFLHLWRFELDQAEEDLLAALELVETTGFASMRTLVLTYLTVLYRFKSLENKVIEFSSLAKTAAESAQMPDYIAAALGNQSWISWRKGDLQAVAQNAKVALLYWQKSPLVYPFQWQALWPLIALTCAQEQSDETWSYLQALLDPMQQCLPAELTANVEASIQARLENQMDSALSFLARALASAGELGYL